MTTATILKELQGLGVSLWVDGEKLRFKARKGVMTEDIKSRLAEHKDELLSLLQKAETEGATPTQLSEAEKGGIPYEVKTINELTASERFIMEEMNIDPADVDNITVTPYGLVVVSGGRRWMEARLGKKPVSNASMAQLKADYNKLLSELRALEERVKHDPSSMDDVIKKMSALMDEQVQIYEAIILGGYSITTEEAWHGIKMETQAEFANDDLEKLSTVAVANDGEKEIEQCIELIQCALNKGTYPTGTVRLDVCTTTNDFAFCAQATIRAYRTWTADANTPFARDIHIPILSHELQRLAELVNSTNLSG